MTEEAPISAPEEDEQCSIAPRERTCRDFRVDAVAVSNMSYQGYANVDWTGVLSL